MKKKLLIAVAILTPIGAVISDVLIGDAVPVVVAGLLALFLVYSLWDPPPKYKEFLYKDVQEATDIALGAHESHGIHDTHDM
jgi:hypothetical protein